jgi:hypothetical protein
VFVACRRRDWQVRLVQLPCGLLDPSQLCLRGAAVENSREHIMRADNHLQRLAQVVAGHCQQRRTEVAIGVSGGVHSTDASPELGIAVQRRPGRPIDHGRPLIKTSVR